MTGVVLLLGAGTGLGMCVVLLGLFPRPIPLGRALAALDGATTPAAADVGEQGGWAGRMGRPAVRLLRRCGLPTARTRRDLTALDKPAAVHLAEQATAAVIGLVLPPGCAALLAAAGIQLDTALAAGGSLLLAIGGFLLPEVSLRTDAARRRAAFRHALGAFLDLVVVSLAGGAGVDQALDDAASVGRGDAFGEIRLALDQARWARIPAWDTLAALGARLGVDQLEELAATVALAGTEGARVRASLRSRAQALRTHQITDAEADASAATERMSLPVVALFAGFLIFLGFPAVAAVTSGL